MENRSNWISCPTAGAGVTAGCTTRWGGCSQGGYAENNLAFHVGDAFRDVTANRRACTEVLGARKVQWLTQVHGNHCMYIDAVGTSTQSPALPPQADAMWTDQVRVALGIMTADCVPILLWDRHGTVVGAAHAGWRGLQSNVIACLLEKMPVAPDMLCAWIGPCICRKHYSVGADVWSEFTRYGPSLVAPYEGDINKRLLDLVGIALHQLQAGGVNHVKLSGICSAADERFYSHRGAGGLPTGRMASLIMLD